MKVHRLRYDLIPSSPDFVIEDAPDITWSESDFEMTLASNVATFEILTECSTIEDARRITDDALRSWYAHMTLTDPNRAVSFRFRDADATMTDDPPRLPHMSESVGIFSSATVRIQRRAYPDLPAGFTFSADVQMLVERYRRYLAGGEPLPGLAYACLTYVEALFGGRNDAASQLHVASTVLSKLGQLSAEAGDALTARKFKSKTNQRAITPDETRWMDAAIRALILRLGMLGGETSKPVLSMADLPAI